MPKPTKKPFLAAVERNLYIAKHKVALIAGNAGQVFYTLL